MELDDLKDLQERVIKEQKPSLTPRIISTIIHNDLTEEIKYDPLSYEQAKVNGYDPGDYYYLGCISENGSKSLLTKVFNKGIDDFEGMLGRTPYKSVFSREDVLNNINSLKPFRENYVIVDADFEAEAKSLLNKRSFDYNVIVR